MRRRHGAIVAEGLTKVYGKLMAVDHESFEVDEAEIFGFLGPNGAGKTAMIKMLNTLTQVSAGRALVNGKGFDVCETNTTMGAAATYMNQVTASGRLAGVTET